ncbi:MAG: hypothetical protein Q8P18_13845 [Pseudomonadota bacterium]|nr:hypothetical protein [Pseudomonadota bacterium]
MSSLLLLLFGCAGLVRSVDYDRETLTAGTVPAPIAPRAVGPLVEPGRAALEGSISAGVRQDPDRTRPGGAQGGWVTRDALHARVAWGWSDWLEGGLGVDAAHTALAGPLARDVSPHARAQLLLRVGQQLRFAAPVTATIRAGALFESELGGLPYYKTETLTTTTSSRQGDDEDWHEDVTVEQDFSEHLVFAWTGRTGLFLGWDTPWGFSVGGGAVAQLVPMFPGYVRQHWSCRTYSDGDTSCGDVPERPPALTYQLAATPWLDVEVPLGPVLLVGRGWVNLADWDLGTPGGVEIGVRWVPARDRRTPSRRGFQARDGADPLR